MKSVFEFFQKDYVWNFENVQNFTLSKNFTFKFIEKFVMILYVLNLKLRTFTSFLAALLSCPVSCMCLEGTIGHKLWLQETNYKYCLLQAKTLQVSFSSLYRHIYWYMMEILTLYSSTCQLHYDCMGVWWCARKQEGT